MSFIIYIAHALSTFGDSDKFMNIFWQLYLYSEFISTNNKTKFSASFLKYLLQIIHFMETGPSNIGLILHSCQSSPLNLKYSYLLSLSVIEFGVTIF